MRVRGKDWAHGVVRKIIRKSTWHGRGTNGGTVRGGPGGPQTGCIHHLQEASPDPGLDGVQVQIHLATKTLLLVL